MLLEKSGSVLTTVKSRVYFGPHNSQRGGSDDEVFADYFRSSGSAEENCRAGVGAERAAAAGVVILDSWK